MKTPEEFIKDRYDWSYEDLERWSDNMKKLPMADFSNVIDLMESYSEHVRENKMSLNSLKELLESYHNYYLNERHKITDSSPKYIIENFFKFKNITK